MRGERVRVRLHRESSVGLRAVEAVMARLSNAGMSRRGSSAVLAPVPEGRASTATSREAPPAASVSSGAAPSQPALSAAAGALRDYPVTLARRHPCRYLALL